MSTLNFHHSCFIYCYLALHTQLVINTAIVYMHRFYMFHPFTRFHRNSIAPAALFLAAKVEEQPRKLEHVIKVAHYILCHHEHSNLDTQSETYLEKAQELVMNENILLQTLGFDVAIDHPHTYVVKCFQLIRTTTELAQTSYFMATNSLHMTTMCLQYRPAVVACVCIYIVCKWSNYEIQRYKEGKDWFAHVDPSVTLEMLENLTAEFLAVLDKYPNRLKKLMNSGPHAGPSSSASSSNSNNNNSNSSSGNIINSEDKPTVRHNNVMQITARPQQVSATSAARGSEMGKPGIVKQSSQPMVPPPVVVSTPQKTVLSHKEYSEKREKERRERERAEMREKHHPPVITTTVSSHHHPNLVHGSSHLSSSSSSSSLHLRPLTTEPVIRTKTSEVPRSVGVSSSMRGAPSYKDKVRKDLLKEKSVKHLIKEKVIETEKSIEGREIKNEVFSKHADIKVKSENIAPVKVIKSEKSEPKVIKSEKSELKEEVKVQTSVKDIKPNTNSFIFNNNDFSLRDFLNPSEMPPEDIFDTEVDSKPSLNNTDFFTVETTHHKLNSPPKQMNHSFNSVPTSNSATQKGISTSGAKQPIEALHSTVVDSKPVSRHSNVNVTSSNNVNLNINHTSDKNIGNGITGAPNSMNTSSNSLPVSSSRKKDKLPSPQCLVSNTAKVKLQRLETTVLPPSIKFDDKHCIPTKDTLVGTNQSTPKGSHHASQKSGSTHATSTTVTTLEKSANSVHSQQTPVIFNPTKLVAEPKKLDALNIRLTRPENCDSLSVVTTSAGSSTPLTNSSSVVSSPLKSHKSDHRHKHKEKKKHKHKEKDKHREKESKDHKKGKKHKKKEKEKDKDRKEEKKSEKQPPKEDASRPLKITIKGISTPDVSATNAKTLPASPVRSTHLERESSTSSADTPARIKLTIPKSRLQGNAAGSHVSPPRGIPPKEVATPKVKLKIPKDNIKPEREKESSKRERDRSSIDLPPAKYARISSSSHAPQFFTFGVTILPARPPIRCNPHHLG
ncbi:Cyclin-T1 [Armadillidium nasatum]|uniref:Cyclin-T1 n=1 Tax=Armadillidium nasatum TaxID=96803 RepID=A0A5N5SUD1_9CRUS|nr:Cyclin-T1 [Armadillidium nasatum]